MAKTLKSKCILFILYNILIKIIIYDFITVYNIPFCCYDYGNYVKF